MTDKTISIHKNFFGAGFSSDPVQLTANEKLTIKQLFEENYIEIFPRYKNKPNVLSLDSWNESSMEFLRYCSEYFDFGIYDEKKNSVHLIDRVKDLGSANLSLGRRSGTNDTVWFYILQNYENHIEKILSEDDESQEKILRLFEKMLSDTNTYITVDGFTKSQIEKKFRHVITQWFPSSVWRDIERKEFNYYNKFIVHFSTQLFILDECLKKQDEGLVQRDINRGWIDKFLYEIQFLMLVLLNIPEIYLRSKGYSSLGNIGIENPFEEDVNRDEFFFKMAHEKSIHELCQDILIDGNIASYSDYVNLCLEADSSNITIRKISHLFRRIFNKLKHSRSVSIFESRDHEGVRKRELDSVQAEINELQKKGYQKSKHTLSEMEKLELEKGLIEKVSYAYEHLDFEDPLFKHNNGIAVFDDRSDKYFRISLYDLEFSLKMIIGVLCSIKNRL